MSVRRILGMLLVILGLPSLAFGAVTFAAAFWQQIHAVPGQLQESWNQVFALLFLGSGAALVCTAWLVLSPWGVENGTLESPRYIRYVGIFGLIGVVLFALTIALGLL